MLRASGQTTGEDIDLQGIVEGDAVETGIPGSKALLTFAEAALGDDLQEIAAARNAVIEALSEAAMVDAAAVIAHFQRMVRIADGTGIQLDPQMAALTTDIREQLGIDSYASAARGGLL